MPDSSAVPMTENAGAVPMAAPFVSLPPSDVISAYLRFRVRELLKAKDEKGDLKWTRQRLAAAVGVNRSHLTLFLGQKHRIGAGPKFIHGILPILGFTKDGLDQAASEWNARKPEPPVSQVA